MLVSALFAACGPGSKNEAQSNGQSTQTAGTQSTQAADSQKAPVEVSFWMLPIAPEDTLKKLVDEFNSSQKKVKVNLSLLQWKDGREQIKQAIGSGKGPDVFYIGVGLDQAYLDAGVLLPLDQAGFTKEDFDKFSPLIQANSDNGKVLAMPLSYDAGLLYYRKDILNQYGFTNPPKTWDELKSMAKKISQGSNGQIMGYQIKGADDHLNAINLTWQDFVSQAGGKFMDLNSKKSAQYSPENVKALEFMKSFYAEGISKLGPSAVNGFREGKIAMYTFNQSNIPNEKFNTNEAMKGKWAVAPLPAGPKASSGYVGGQGIAINSKTAHKAEAGEFVKWFGQPAHSSIWMEASYGIPVYDLDKIDADAKQKIQAVMDKDAENWNAIMAQIKLDDPNIMIEQRYGYTARWDAQKKYIISALSGEVSVEDALKSIDAQINQSLQ